MPRKRTIQEYIQIASEIHVGRYTYEKSSFDGNYINVTCPHHGEFRVSKVKHIQTSPTPAGCPRCALEKTQERSQSRRMGIELFVERAKQIHGTAYDYSMSVYKSNNTKLTIICPSHGLFDQTPSKHIGSNGIKGTGCPSCAKVTTYDLFVSKSENIHGKGRYDYSGYSFTNSKTKSAIKCNVCDSIFTCSPGNHMRGHGCPKCNVSVGAISETLFDKKPYLKYVSGYVYVYRFGQHIKVGITQNHVEKRYRPSLGGELLFSYQQPLYVCFLAEQMTLSDFVFFKRSYEPLRGNGHTECLVGIDSQIIIDHIMRNADTARRSFLHSLEPNQADCCL